MSEKYGNPPKIDIRDSVFTRIMQDKDIRFAMYCWLHPEDTQTTPDEIEMITLENVLTDSMFNDVGFIAGNRIIVLCEAQTKWDLNATARYLIYAVGTLHKYLERTKQDLHGAKVSLPKIEIYMIFTGRRSNVPDVLSFAEEFQQENIDLRVKVITSPRAYGDIVWQFLNFVSEYERLLDIHGRTSRTLEELYAVCLEKGILRNFMITNKSEVFTMMDRIFSQEAATLAYGKRMWAQGMSQGMAQGRQSALTDTVRRMLDNGFSSEQAAAATGLSVDVINAL